MELLAYHGIGIINFKDNNDMENSCDLKLLNVFYIDDFMVHVCGGSREGKGKTAENYSGLQFNHLFNKVGSRISTLLHSVGGKTYFP